MRFTTIDTDSTLLIYSEIHGKPSENNIKLIIKAREYSLQYQFFASYIRLNVKNQVVWMSNSLQIDIFASSTVSPVEGLFPTIKFFSSVWPCKVC